jgi:hypothetical protein
MRSADAVSVILESLQIVVEIAVINDARVEQRGVLDDTFVDVFADHTSRFAILGVDITINK